MDTYGYIYIYICWEYSLSTPSYGHADETHICISYVWLKHLPFARFADQRSISTFVKWQLQHGS